MYKLRSITCLIWGATTSELPPPPFPRKRVLVCSFLGWGREKLSVGWSPDTNSGPNSLKAVQQCWFYVQRVKKQPAALKTFPVVSTTENLFLADTICPTTELLPQSLPPKLWPTRPLLGPSQQLAKCPERQVLAAPPDPPEAFVCCEGLGPLISLKSPTWRKIWT